MNALEEIKHYIAEPNTVGALMISGKWGCGKTYLIEHELCDDKEVSEKCHILRISLFGEESIDSVTRKVKRKMMGAFRIANLSKENNKKSNEDKNDNPDKDGNGFNKFISGLKTVSNIAGAFTPFGNAINAIASVDVTEFYECKNEISKKIVVLVFDDFERSRLQPDELLGCINEFVETYNIKTIIVSNEEKLGISGRDGSTEDKKEDSNDKENKDTSDKKQKASKYLEFKEKVVSRTIKLTPDYEAVIDHILQSSTYVVDSYRAFLDERKGMIERVFKGSMTENIRSLKCALQDFERVYQIIISQSISSKNTELFFAAFLIGEFEIKSGNITKQDKYGYYPSYTSLGEKYSDFNSRYVIDGCYDWLTEGRWEEQLITDYLLAVGKDANSMTPSELLLTSPVLTLSDEQLNTGIEEALVKGYAGDLFLREYDSLLTFIANCKSLHIEIEQSIDASQLKYGINSRLNRIISGELIDEPRHTLFEESVVNNLSEELKQVLKLLDNFDDQKYQRKYKYRFLQAYREGNIGKITDLNAENNFFFDDEMANVVFDFYTNSSQEARYDFLRYFISKYKKAVFFNDEDRLLCCTNLELLCTKVSGIERQQSTERAMDNVFVENLHEIVRKKRDILLENS